MRIKKSKRAVSKDSVGFESVDALSHFNCGYCKKWWSGADAPIYKKVVLPMVRGGDENRIQAEFQVLKYLSFGIVKIIDNLWADR